MQQMKMENTFAKNIVLQEDFGIKMTKTLEGEVHTMCNLSKGVEEKGIEKGIEKATLRAIENLMDSLKMTAEQAMTVLKVPETEWIKYSDRLKL